ESPRLRRQDRGRGSTRVPERRPSPHRSSTAHPRSGPWRAGVPLATADRYSRRCRQRAPGPAAHWELRRWSSDHGTTGLWFAPRDSLSTVDLRTPAPKRILATRSYSHRMPRRRKLPPPDPRTDPGGWNEAQTRPRTIGSIALALSGGGHRATLFALG